MIQPKIISLCKSPYCPGKGRVLTLSQDKNGHMPSGTYLLLL